MIKKILCSLIIGFGLVSFSNAGEISRTFNIPDTLVINDSVNLILDNMNFSTTYLSVLMNRVFYVRSVPSWNGHNTNMFMFAWYEGQPYMFSTYMFDGGIRQSQQGFVQTICVIQAGSGSSCNDYNLDVSVFLNASGFNHGYVNYGDGNRAYDMLQLCFGNNEYDYCFRSSAYLNNPDHPNQSQLSGSLGLTSYNPDDINRISWSSSPFSNSSVPSVPSVPDYEFDEDDEFTNKQIIEGYNAMGLTDEFCYGGFDIDNIFEAGTIPQEFTGYRWGGGAFIFDIWDIYSGAYNNDYISFIRSFYISYENNNYSDFYGKTKAIYGFINQWFSVSSKGLGFIESTAPTFTLVDVWQYCDLKFNQNPDSIYTGDRRDPKFRYYTSGQVNLGGYFNFSGNNNYFSGNLSGFNTPKDFFASLNSIFQGGLNNLENRDPVLPTYIIIFFLAIIFIRIISH